MSEKLPLDAKIALISKMIDDFAFYVEAGSCPKDQEFTITSRDEGVGIEAGARFTALKKLAYEVPLKKIAFDTRRMNQDTDRNPRRNLQYWHRTEDFIDDETSEKLKVFKKLNGIVKSIQSQLSEQPEWFDSYVRALSNNLDRLEIKRAGDSSVEVFKPHVSYLEQLIYNRYRLTLDDIKEASELSLRDRIMSKDEELEKRGQFLMSNGSLQNKNGNTALTNEQLLSLIASIKDNGSNNHVNQKDALAELFGGNSLRRAGEKTVERTITIKITDSVID